ncbi:MAG: TPM domain-containing protein [Butyrivibrio sp.]
MMMKKNVLTMLFALLLCLMVIFPAFAASDMPRLVDNADLLTDSEESTLLSRLDEISLRQQADIVVVTVDTLNGKTPMEYADDFYDYGGYGRDGVLLLVSMEERDWYISTSGYGITAITDAGIEYISDKFRSGLSDGNYAEAFETYAKLCDEFFTQAKTGKPYDTGNMPKEPFSIVRNLIFALVVGFVISLIVTGVMKGKLKTVRFQSAAGCYIKANSMNVTECRDMFLYAHVDRRAIPKETSGSSGGSATHTSSSGNTHGGGGGKF